MSPPPPPLRTVRATLTAHGSSKPIHSSAYGVSLSGSIPLLVRPLDTLLARRPCASVSNSQSSVYPLQGRFTGHTSAPCRVRYIPIQRVMIFPCLSAAGLGFLWLPTPDEELALSYEWVTALADRIGVFLFRIREIQQGREPTIRRRLWCAYRVRENPRFTCDASTVSATVLGGLP